jgi:WD40 repeat protein
MNRTRFAAVLVPLLLSSLLFSPQILTSAFTQSQDPQDKRGIRADASPTPTPGVSQPAQAVARAAKPEIVLQAGITSPQSQIAFSPNGQLLASMGLDGNAIKVWEISTGRLLRQVESGIPTMGVSSMARPFRFSSDGKALIAFAESRVRRWDVETGRELPSTLLPTATNFMNAKLSQDAGMLAAQSFDNSSIRLWDIRNTRELTPIKLDEEDQLNGQNSIAISPDGGLVVAVTARFETSRRGSTSSKEIVSIWNTANNKKVHTLNLATTTQQLGIGAAWNPDAIAVFSDDGSSLAVRSGTVLKVWEVSTGKELKSIQAGNAVTTRDDPLAMFTNNVAFSPDKHKLSLVAEKNKIGIFDASTGATLHNLTGHEGNVVGLRFSADGKTLASSASDNKIKLWDVASGREITTLSGAAVPVTDLAFSTDGKTLSVAAHQSVSFWELTTGGVRRSLALPDEYSRSSFNVTDRGAVLSPDGKLLMAGSQTQSQVRVWDVTSGKELSNIALGQNKKLGNAVFSGDGKTVVLIEGEVKKPASSSTSQLPADFQMPDPTKMMEQMKKNPKKLEQELKKAQEAMAKGDLSAGMALMESMGMMPKKANQNPNTMRILEPASGRQLSAVPMPGGFLADMAGDSIMTSSALSFSPDGRVLASATGFNSPIKLVDTTSGQELKTLKVPFSMGVNTIAWSPDGKRLASAQWGMSRPIDPNNPGAIDFSFEDMSFSVRLWDPATGAEISNLAGHKNFVMKLAFSPDSRVLASAGYDSIIKLWDVGSGRELRTLTGHTGAINAIAFSPDGRFIVSGSDDGSTRLWNAHSGELLATLATINNGNDWVVVTPSGLFDGSPGGWNQIMWRFSPALNDVSPVELFFNEYFHPGLLSDILEGKKLAVATDISQKDRRQPKLALTIADATNGKVSTRTAKVSINITDAPAGAQDVRLFRNGSLVKVWRGDVLKGQPTAMLETTVSFTAGENELRAYAFNRDNVKSTDATLTLTGADTLKRAGTLHLIVAGVNQYTNPEYNLKYAVADAGSFAEEIERQQRKLGKYVQIKITSLLDQNATKANLLYALNRLAGNSEGKKPEGAPAALDEIVASQPEDAVVLFFAGHGTAQRQRFYLIPHDMGYLGKRTELDQPGLESILRHGVSDLELEQVFEGIDAGMMLMVIDACNSGQALEAEEKRRGPMNSKGLAQLAYEKGMYIMTAAQSYQAALEASQLGHGYLTYALVEEGLKVGAADVQPKDGEVVLREWLDYATDRVPEMQVEKMRTARGLRVELAFVEGEETVTDIDKRNVQRPRVFYRREHERQPMVVAKP